MNFTDLKSIIEIYVLYLIVTGIGMCLVVYGSNLFFPHEPEIPLSAAVFTAALLSGVLTLGSLPQIGGD